MSTETNEWPSNIDKLLEATGQSQKDLAKTLGVELITVQRWQKGKATPTGTAELVLRALLASKGISVGAAATSAVLSIVPMISAIAGGIAGTALMASIFGDKSKND